MQKLLCTDWLFTEFGGAGKCSIASGMLSSDLSLRNALEVDGQLNAQVLNKIPTKSRTILIY